MNENELIEFQRNVLNDELSLDVWADKYRAEGEKTRADTDNRFVNAIYAKDPKEQAREYMRKLVQRSLFVPGGRIIAGAGTGYMVTLGNCYVSETVQDSMMGIQRMISRASRTLQYGGGVGTNYSTIRPHGAIVKRTGSVSMGAIPFARQHNTMALSILSMNTRRAANMMTLADDHPDLWNPDQFDVATDSMTGRKFLRNPSFLSVKTWAGELECFNISVLVSDRFLAAVEQDMDWDLGFHVPRADGNHVDVYSRPFAYDAFEVGEDLQYSIDDRNIEKGTMLPWYVYRRVKARFLWDQILRTTYEYAEPGIIFIDRVNERNNLNYCEHILATNPCGEQPLPPDGMCDLGALNLAFMVKKPFTKEAEMDWDVIAGTTLAGIRFLDNVLDVTEYPLEAQRKEAMAKRRIGLGVMGWGDALVQMGIRYGSPDSVTLSRKVALFIQRHSYVASTILAQERGPFPLWDCSKFNYYNVMKLSERIQESVEKYGLRNGVCNTIAPTGTTGEYVGGVSRGHEPCFSFKPSTRKVKQTDGTTQEYETIPYSLRLWRAMYDEHHLANQSTNAFIGALEISVEEHIRVHAAWSEHIDASVSKTVNCPADMSYEDFKNVYDLAYQLGCKGCTTYRPSGVRGSVLQEKLDNPTGVDIGGVISEQWETRAEGTGYNVTRISDDSDRTAIRRRPDVLPARVHKLKWPQTGDNWYIHLSADENRLRELFLTCPDPNSREWVEALARVATAVLRTANDPRFLFNELKRIASAAGGAFVDDPTNNGKKWHAPSIVAAIGAYMEAEHQWLASSWQKPYTGEQTDAKKESAAVNEPTRRPDAKEQCSKCGEHTIIHEFGCKRCISCGYEECG